jgi:ABC-type transporter Mla MlaB component
MKITTTQKDGKSVIKIEGDLLVSTVADAKPDLVAILEKGDDIFLDLGEIGEVDTGGVQLLLMIRTSAMNRGKRFAALAQSASIRAMLERIGIPSRYFEDQERTH